MIVYLGGPIAGCTDNEAKDWREYAKENLTCQTLDPMVRDYRGRESDFVNEIVELDKQDIMKSDTLLVWHPRPSTGTDMETIFAWMNHKTIVMVIPEGAPVSPWVLYHSTIVFKTIEHAVEWINNENQNVPRV